MRLPAGQTLKLVTWRIRECSSSLLFTSYRCFGKFLTDPSTFHVISFEPTLLKPLDLASKKTPPISLTALMKKSVVYYRGLSCSHDLQENELYSTQVLREAR